MWPSVFSFYRSCLKCGAELDGMQMNLEVTVSGLCTQGILEYSRIAFDLFFNEVLVILTTQKKNMPKLLDVMIEIRLLSTWLGTLRGL